MREYIIVTPSISHLLERKDAMRGRQFSHSSVALARQVKKAPTLSKAAIAARARQRALKAGKSIYDSEKMTLLEAINVLRVRQHVFLLPVNF